MRTLTILIFTFFCLVSAKAQQVKFHYYSTSDAAIAEVYNRTKNKVSTFQSVVAKIDSMEALGKVILSSTEYAPIKNRINRAPVNPGNPEEMELHKYASEAKEKYVPVTSLFDSKK